MKNKTGNLIDPNRVYTLKDAAKLLQVKKSTLSDLVKKQNKICAVPLGKKVGKRYLFSGASIHKFLCTANFDTFIQKKKVEREVIL